MAVFLSDIAFIFELFAIAAGLLLLDRAASASGGYTKLAGWLLIVGGLATALCTGYYWVKYNKQGDLDHAYPPAMMQGMQGMSMKKMMRPKGMGQQGMGGMKGGMMMNDGQPQGMQMGSGGNVRHQPDARQNQEQATE